ncbi:MAG: tetratricopeptide repeat protein [Planctomycetota bacterium]|jgi:hypothetical protein
MEKLKNITIIFSLAVALLSSVAPAKTTSVLLQEGLYAEEITGDLDAAIKIYEQVISKSKETQRAAAQATYRIGMCFLKKGNKTKAAEYFQQIVSNYQDAKGLVEKATQQLKKILPQHEDQLPWEAMVYIYDKHMEAHKKAKSKGIGVNSHIVGVDEDFIKYPGGILTHETSNKVAAGKEIWLGNFSQARDVEFFNEQLEPQQIRFSKRETNAIGKYMLLWKADRDMEAGEVRVIAYRSKKTNKLIATENGYKLGFNNHYGSPVLENFFLVVPLDVSIVEQSREYTRRKKFDMCEIYHWQKENPANTTNKVDVVLAKIETLMQDYAESVPVDQLIKSGKVPSFKTQIYDNTALDLETGVSVPFMDEWPTLCDVAWDNDGGGALMIKPKSSVRFIALGAAENWEDAISIARNSIGILRTSTSKGMFASQSKFAAVLTSEGNLAVIQINEHDSNKGTIYGWVEKIPAEYRSFGPVMERVINDDGEEKNWLIDFDTGKLFSHSIEIPSEEKFLRWCAENRIDAMGETRTSGPGLYGFDMAVIPIETETWETISPKELADDLSVAKGGTPALMSAAGNLPVTYIFKTREGGMGIVQILHMQHNKKPRHFRIRYKMLQEPAKIAPVEVFGPVKEVTLYDIEHTITKGKPCAINFATDRVTTISRQHQTSEFDIVEWVRRRGIDAVAETGSNKSNKPSLIGIDLAVVSMPSEDWDKITPAELRKLQGSPVMRIQEATLMSYYEGQDQPVYAFRTREGQYGILQIIDFNKQAQDVRFRYKEKAKSPIDLSTPEATIKSFVKAVYDGNLEAAGACVSKEGHDYDEFKEMLATESNHPFQAMIKAMDVSVPVEITSKSIKDGKCKLSWYFTLGRVYYFGETKMKKGMHQEFSSYLELVGDKWLIRDI